MSKLLRSELKGIVKECLIEILSEGLNTDTSYQINETKYSVPKKTAKRNRSKPSHLDNIVYNKRKEEIKENVLNSKITSDPVLNELLADTAISTLQEQASAEKGKNSNVIVAGDSAAKMAADSDPSELFSESSSKWAHLAFSK